jgi:hypothetical protein
VRIEDSMCEVIEKAKQGDEEAWGIQSKTCQAQR